MALTCTTGRFILSPAATAGYYWYFDKVDRYINSAYYTSVDDYYEIPTGSVIGATQYYSPNQVYLLVKKALDGSINYPAEFIVLQSTSGDNFNKLLSSEVVGNNLVVKMFALTAKEITTITFPMPIIYDNQSPAEVRQFCFTDFVLEEGVLLSSYCDSTILVEIFSDGAGGVTYEYTVNSVQCGWVNQLDPVIFTETKRIEYRRGCFKNPIYLVWKNTKGGWDKWLFEYNQIESIVTQSLGEFFNYYTSLADINNISTEIGKEAKPIMTIGADALTLDQKRAITTLLYSNKVYVIGTDGAIISEVKVTEGTFLIQESKKSLFDIEFQIELPQINTLRN